MGQCTSINILGIHLNVNVPELAQMLNYICSPTAGTHKTCDRSRHITQRHITSNTIKSHKTNHKQYKRQVTDSINDIVKQES